MGGQFKGLEALLGGGTAEEFVVTELSTAAGEAISSNPPTSEILAVEAQRARGKSLSRLRALCWKETEGGLIAAQTY